MLRPSFARYAELVTGVLDASGARDGCADLPATDALDTPDDAVAAREAERRTVDPATRQAACTLRPPSPSAPRARPSPTATYRGMALPAPTAAPDARLDRRG